MNVHSVLLVDQAIQAATNPWERALLVPIGSEPAIVHYARLLAQRCDHTSLVLPVGLKGKVSDMNGSGVRIHTYSRFLADGSLGRSEWLGGMSELILVDAGRLPRLDPRAMQRAHRNAGAAMTLFYDCPHEHYCREHIATDPAGVIRRTIRQYTDSSCILLNRQPLAAVLSRRSFRLDRTCRASNLVELIEYLDRRVRRAGGRVHRVLNQGIRGHDSPMEALLCLVEQIGEARDQNGIVHVPAVAHARIHGPVEMGRGVQIGAGAIIVGPVALGDGAIVGPGAIVSRSIVLPGQEIPASGHCHHQVIGPQQEHFPHGPEMLTIRSDVEDADIIPASKTDRRLKRAMDIAGAAIGLVLLAPLFAVVAILIKLTSPGPVFFRHRRQGRGGVEFGCLKFRTMVQNADAMKLKLRVHNEVDGPQFKLVNDPRVTRIGRTLRRTNIDELPQLIDVLRGQMSLVGPRPSPDCENQCCPPWRKARLSVRPGITGLWQVARSSDRHQTDFQEWIYYDTRYVERRSVWLDVQILWQTLRIVVGLGPAERWRQRWQPEPSDLVDLRHVHVHVDVDVDSDQTGTLATV